MPLLLRGADKRRWDWPGPAFPWLGHEEYPAAPFGDLRTDTSSHLSTWEVTDDRENLLRVITALAAGKQNADKFDYVLIDQTLLGALSITIKATHGKTPDTEGNRLWHRDLVELTGDKLIRLVHLVRNQGEMGRLLDKKIAELLREALRVGQLDRARVDERLLRSLGE